MKLIQAPDVLNQLYFFFYGSETKSSFSLKLSNFLLKGTQPK